MKHNIGDVFDVASYGLAQAPHLAGQLLESILCLLQRLLGAGLGFSQSGYGILKRPLSLLQPSNPLFGSGLSFL